MTTPRKEPTKRGRKPGSGSAFDVYFASSPCASETPVVIFHHIQKTAGTSLRQIIHRNYVQAGARHLVVGAPRGYDPRKMREWTAGFLDALSAKERETIVCVAGHGANHLMDRLGRPTRAITLLREPVDRILSRYYFGQVPDFDLADFYLALQRDRNQTKSKHRRQYCNAQSRSLLGPLFKIEFSELRWSHGAPANAQRWRERLFGLVTDRYLVGLQDRLEESVAYFGRACGWNDLSIPHSKHNTERPRDVDEELRAEILAHNWLDQELYQHFASRPIGAGNSEHGK